MNGAYSVEAGERCGVGSSSGVAEGIGTSASYLRKKLLLSAGVGDVNKVLPAAHKDGDYFVLMQLC